MKQEMVGATEINRFRQQCEALLQQGYTVVPGSVAIAKSNPDNYYDAVCVAFFDPPASTETAWCGTAHEADCDCVSCSEGVIG